MVFPLTQSTYQGSVGFQDVYWLVNKSSSFDGEFTIRIVKLAFVCVPDKIAISRIFFGSVNY